MGRQPSQSLLNYQWLNNFLIIDDEQYTQPLAYLGSFFCGINLAALCPTIYSMPFLVAALLAYLCNPTC